MRFLSKLMLMALIGMMWSCSKDEDQSAVEMGLSSLEEKDYTEALAYFQSAIVSGVKGDTLAIAYIGAGWCEVKLDSFSVALDYFTAGYGASKSDELTAEAAGGWAFAAWALDDPQTAVDKTAEALSLDAGYQSLVNSRIDSYDLIWIRAAAYYQLGQYAESIAEVKRLDATFQGSVTDQDIASKLLVKIESLGAVVVI